MENKQKFTDAQLKAIHTTGSNVLVSAGAGSGKTAVLTERVLVKLLQGVDIDELIILTFTNAAATEMKHRIKERIEMHPELKKQLSHLDNAIISTFDSFALQIVKTYSYLLNIDSHVSISDSVLLNQAKEIALNNAIEKAYLNPTDGFKNTVDLYFDKGDLTIIEGVKALIKGLELIPDPLKFLERYEQRYFSKEFFEQVLIELEESIITKSIELGLYLKYFNKQFEHSNPEKTDGYFFALNQFLEDVNHRDSLDSTLNLWIQFSYPSKPRAKKDDGIDHAQFSVYHERLKKDFKALQKSIVNLKFDSSKQLVNSILSTKESSLAMVEIAKDYLVEKSKIMMERRLYGFGDIMNLAITLFEEHPEIRIEFVSKINEIMVDEYQDTSDIQERLLTILEKNNLFMVGDLKQSIYGFRNANPDNFYKKYIDYLEGKNGVLIELVENFRSRKEVLSGINKLFMPLMDKEIGGIDYRDNQSLVYGNKNYDLYDSLSGHVEILTYSKSEEKERNVLFHPVLHETRIVLTDIIDKTISGFEVMDLKKKVKRSAVYSDFAILCDRQSSFDMIEEEFGKYNIPILKVSDDVFSMSTEIQVLHQFIRLVSCYKDSQKFKEQFRSTIFGLARSFIYQIEDESIIDFLLSLTGEQAHDLDMLKKHPQLSGINHNIEKVLEGLESTPVYLWLMDVLEETQFYQRLSTLSSPQDAEMRLDFLMEKIQVADLFDFSDLLDYLEYVYVSKEVDIEYARTVDFQENKVKLMTMHKSKGLEFPITYYIGLSSKFNFQENKSPFIFKQEYGLISKPFDGEFYETALHYLAKDRSKRKDRSERLRLLYVAMTRAKEQLSLVANQDEFFNEAALVNDSGVVLKNERLSVQSFVGFLKSVELTRNWIKEGVVQLNAPYQEFSHAPSIPLMTGKSFELNHSTIIEAHLSKTTVELLDDETKQKMVYGKKIHKIFEDFDFSSVQSSFGKVSKEFHAPLQRFIDVFGRELNEALEIYQEVEFFDTQDNLEIHGIIDFFAILKDKVLLIDYKLKSVSDPVYVHQIKGYQRYLEKVTKLPVEAYLFSLVTGTTKEIK